MAVRDAFNRISDRFLHQWIDPEDNLLEVIRYRFLFWVMVIATVLVSVTVPFNFQSQDWRQWSRSFITIGTFLSLLIYLRKTGRYKVVAHIAHGISVFVILVNTYFIFQIFNAISLLIFFLNVLFTYFMLGYRWGTVYSLVNFLPMIIYVTLLEGGARISLMIEPKDVTNQEFLINFVGILLINIYLMFTLVRAFQTSGQRYADMLARQKQMNQQLSKKEQDLAYANIEMKRANIALKKANRSAEASSRAKSEFLSTMSHEIRTPMNAVIGMTHILLDENPREEQKTHLNLLKFSAENLLVLINDILDFNKIEAGKIEFENIEFNLVELVHKIGRGLEPKAQERNLDFRIAIDPKITWTLMGDPTRLSQVLTNLLSNAIKFTKKGHIKVWVALKGERENTATVLFSVEDTGIGIPTAKIKQVFESFSQASSDTTRKFGGTGLGLAIVKRLLELQGSEIQVESQFGQGSRFFFEQAFTIERSKPLFSTTERKVPSNERDLKGKSILLVEDNPSNVLVARKFLERWNAKLSLAENGELAMEALRDQTFDLILMDLQMPLLDGYQATMLIRSLDDESKRNIPIIALTASAMVEIQDRVYAVGMNDYVSKPFNPNELYQKIVKNLEKNQAV